jgi:peptide/nickel transport system substrate-binding protein
MLRLNHLQGPTADRAIRQAIMAAIDPVEIMQAFVGDDESQYTAPVGVFVPNVPSASSAGMERLGGKRSNAEVRALLRAAGYGGERLVALHAVDNAFSNTVMQVVVARLRAVGMNLDDVAIDQGTLVQRRNSKEPLDKGGWSLMPVNPSGADHLDPLVALGLRTGAAAWVGWPDNKRMEELRTAWIDSNDEGERRSLTIAIQEEALAEVVYIPLGRYFLPSAWRRGLSGILNTTVPVFWNVRKA